jgi:hypothetical protein
MLAQAKPEQVPAILGAMLAVAAAGGAERVTDADRASVAAASRYIFCRPAPLDFARLPAVGPAELAATIADPAVAAEALSFLTVMAFVDGVLDTDKIARVLDYASALGIEAAYLTEIAEAAQGHLSWALMDMTRRNVESITGRTLLSDDVMAWLLPYRDAGADPALAARFDALARLPPGSFGRAFWEFYQANRYTFPGNPAAANAAFVVPHDSTHLLSGYDTSAAGEILVSTFTAAMHPKYPMAGHVLPVIFSWHLGIKINDLAGSATGALDPQRFWRAWARGSEIAIDVFDPSWDFWAATREGLDDLRRRYRLSALEPAS